MAINPFIFDNEFFTRKNYVSPLYSKDLDIKFNEIIDYINRELLTVLNGILQQQFKGINNPVYLGFFFVNVGNGTTTWKQVTDEAIAFSSLEISKLENNDDNVLLLIDDTKQIVPTTPQNFACLGTDNSQFNSVFLTSDYLIDRSIKSEHIEYESITARNINYNSLDVAINSIDNDKFVIDSFGQNNITDNDADMIIIDHLDVALAAVWSTCIYPNMIPNNYLSDSNWYKLLRDRYAYNNVLAGYDIEYRRICGLDINIFDAIKFEQITLQYIESFDIDMLNFNSINANRLIFKKTANSWYPSENDIIDDGQITLDHLSPALRTELGL